jgi:integrase
LTISEAVSWRQEMQVTVRVGKAGAPSQVTLAEAAESWVSLARRGVVRTRSGDAYKPSALRSYESALRQLLPRFGHLRLSAVTRVKLQDLVDELVAAGAAPSTVRNLLLPLRAIFRRAGTRDEVHTNPTLKLELPAVRARRDRVARPIEAAALIETLPVSDRPIWALALYAGLRLGELQALSWSEVDLEPRLIRVERAWDRKVGLIEPKSRSGKRRVPMTSELHQMLLEHRLRQGHGGIGFVLGRTPTLPFDSWQVTARARRAWKAAGLDPIGFHECRHTYAAFMIAAGVNAKALSTYMGHSTITVTLDRYGHLLPGNEQEAARLLELWLRAASAGNST